MPIVNELLERYKQRSALTIIPLGPREPPTDNEPPPRGLKRAPMRVLPDQISIEEGRTMGMPEVQTYLRTSDPDHCLGLNMPAGAGKTTLAVQVAEQAANAGKKVVFVGPRRGFFDTDILPIAKRPEWWHKWKPRVADTDMALDNTCRWPEQMTLWTNRGYRPIHFCLQETVCGQAYMQNHCPYYSQGNEKTRIWYVQYEHITLGHPALKNADLVIGDELPLRGFLGQWEIPAHKIKMAMNEPQLDRLLSRLYSLTTTLQQAAENEERVESIAGKALIEKLSEAVDLPFIFERHEGFMYGEVEAPEISTLEETATLAYNYVPKMLRLLSELYETVQEGIEPIERIRLTRSHLILYDKHGPAKLPKHVIWLDATADQHMYESLFERKFKMLSADIKQAGRVFQIYNSLNNKRAMEVESKREHLKQTMEHIIKEREYKKPAVITYKDMVDYFEPNPDNHSWFNGSRGENKLGREHDVLFVIGAPKPRDHDLKNMAAMIYRKRRHAFDATWSQRDIPFYNQPFSIPVSGYWNDQDLQTVLEQFREREIQQAINRLRILIRPCDVYLFTSVVIPEQRVILMSQQQLFNAPDGVDMYIWQRISETAASIALERGFVTSSDLVKSAGVHRDSSQKYIKELIAAGWIPHVVRGRGKPTLAAKLPELVSRY